jgi:cyclophilin family peptidyl-prolyl cis-trans isomerase
VADSYDPTDPKWDSDEALENLKMERQVNPDLDNERLTKKLFDEASPLAAQTIINLALHGTNENTRLNAARYITDKVYDGDGGPTRSRWEELVGEAVSDAELHANTGSASGD